MSALRLKMQCLYVAGTLTECLLRRGVHLWEVTNALLELDCVLRRSVYLWEVKIQCGCGWFLD